MEHYATELLFDLVTNNKNVKWRDLHTIADGSSVLVDYADDENNVYEIEVHVRPHEKQAPKTLEEFMHKFRHFLKRPLSNIPVNLRDYYD